MIDKTLDADAVADLVHDGMTIGIGGWGSRRKPLDLVRAVVRSGARELTVVSFGGPDVGILCATGQASRVVHGFVTLDSITVEPHFARARQAGTVESVELDEAMLLSGLRAAAHRLPFEVTRAGLGSDAVTRNPGILTVRSPYADGEELIAMPAIPLDLALVHVHRADGAGNAQLLAGDVYFDDLFAAAAARTVVSCEEVVPTEALTADAAPSTLVLHRGLVHGVVHAPHGAAFTACEPYYPRDEEAQRAYADAADAPEAFLAGFAGADAPPKQVTDA